MKKYILLCFCIAQLACVAPDPASDRVDTTQPLRALMSDVAMIEQPGHPSEDCSSCHDPLEIPVFLIPLHVSSAHRPISSVCVDTSSIHEQEVAMRVIELDHQWDVGVPVPAQTLTVPPGFQTTCIDSLSYSPSQFAHFLQVFLMEPRITDPGRILSASFTANGETHVFPASTGSGCGRTRDRANPYVEWTVPCLQF